MTPRQPHGGLGAGTARSTAAPGAMAWRGVARTGAAPLVMAWIAALWVTAARVGMPALALLTLAMAMGPARAAPTVEDTMAQRVLACTGCHGPQGRAARDGYYPRIAGKPAGYLYRQLLAFRDGRRAYALMTHLLAPLDDAYLQAIAEHFAGLDIAYPPPLPPPADVDRAALARGALLVRDGDAARGLPACSQCHAAGMMGRQPGVPALLGLPRDYLNAQLGAWRNGSRRADAPDCMAEVAKRLAPADIAAVSLWLALQPVPPGAKPAAAEPGVVAGRVSGAAADGGAHTIRCAAETAPAVAAAGGGGGGGIGGGTSSGTGGSDGGGIGGAAGGRVGGTTNPAAGGAGR